jgi:hypothetical protein
MRACGILGTVAMLLAAAAANAELTVSAGNWTLHPDTGMQDIQVRISGTGNVTNATVNLGVTGAGTRPALTGGSIISNTIFALNNTGSPSYDFTNPAVAYLDVATNSGTVAVNSDSLLATITVDTTGVSLGTYTLNLLGTPYGNSSVGTEPTTGVSYTAGSILMTAVPEPISVLFPLSLGVVGLLTRRRR